MDKCTIFFCLILTTVYAESQNGLLEAIFGTATIQSSQSNNNYNINKKENTDSESEKAKSHNIIKEILSHLHLHKPFNHEHKPPHPVHKPPHPVHKPPHPVHKPPHQGHKPSHTIHLPIPVFQEIVIHKPHLHPIHFHKPTSEHNQKHEEKPNYSNYYVIKPNHESQDENHMETYYVSHIEPDDQKDLDTSQYQPVFVQIDQKPQNKPSIYIPKPINHDSNPQKPENNQIHHKPELKHLSESNKLKNSCNNKPTIILVQKPTPNYDKPDYEHPVFIQITPEKLNDILHKPENNIIKKPPRTPEELVQFIKPSTDVNNNQKPFLLTINKPSAEENPIVDKNHGLNVLHSIYINGIKEESILTDRDNTQNNDDKQIKPNNINSLNSTISHSHSSLNMNNPNNTVNLTKRTLNMWGLITRPFQTPQSAQKLSSYKNEECNNDANQFSLKQKNCTSKKSNNINELTNLNTTENSITIESHEKSGENLLNQPTEKSTSPNPQIATAASIFPQLLIPNLVQKQTEGNIKEEDNEQNNNINEKIDSTTDLAESTKSISSQ